jgi:YesN/AraC family two-component response regulator
MFLLLLYSEQTTATARTPLLEALLMQMAPMAHGFELCAPDAAFSLATEVLQHLNLCFAEELSLTELTNRFHVSTSHMIHMFKAQFGLPPIQYMVRRRIGEAQHLLRTTEDSAGDIAGRVGMINRNYFYRMFKRLVGVSPVRYREVIGERPDMLA